MSSLRRYLLYGRNAFWPVAFAYASAWLGFSTVGPVRRRQPTDEPEAPPRIFRLGRTADSGSRRFCSAKWRLARCSYWAFGRRAVLSMVEARGAVLHLQSTSRCPTPASSTAAEWTSTPFAVAGHLQATLLILRTETAWALDTRLALQASAGLGTFSLLACPLLLAALRPPSLLPSSLPPHLAASLFPATSSVHETPEAVSRITCHPSCSFCSSLSVACSSASAIAAAATHRPSGALTPVARRGGVWRWA